MIPELLLALSGIPGDVIEHRRHARRDVRPVGVSKKAVDASRFGRRDRCVGTETVADGTRGVRAATIRRDGRKEKEKRNARVRVQTSDGGSLDEMLVQPYEERLLHLEQKILDGSIEPSMTAIEDFLGEFSISLVGTTGVERIIEDDADEEDDTSEMDFTARNF